MPGIDHTEVSPFTVVCQLPSTVILTCEVVMNPLREKERGKDSDAGNHPHNIWSSQSPVLREETASAAYDIRDQS